MSVLVIMLNSIVTGFVPHLLSKGLHLTSAVNTFYIVWFTIVLGVGVFQLNSKVEGVHFGVVG